MISCPLCNSRNIKNVFKNKHSHFTDGITKFNIFSVELCLDCSFVFQGSAYDESYDKLAESLYTSYNSNTYFSFPRRDNKTLESLDFIINNIQLDSSCRILEIGSGYGDFLYLINEKTDAEILGIEPDISGETNIPTLKAFYTPELFDEKFDLIILKQTFEHFKFPQKFKDSFFAALKDDGFLYIEVPSFDIVQSHFLEDFSADHVNYFSINTIQNLFHDYHLYCYDNSYFLRVIFQNKKREPTTKTDNSASIINFFNEYSIKLHKIQEYIAHKSHEDAQIVFYGAGLYFRSLFAGLKDRLNLANCYICDDNMSLDTEPVFGLKNIKLANLSEQETIIIACSNDYFTQQSIKKTATEILPVFTFIHLYESIQHIGKY